MKECWGEGELRAWIDGELPAEQASALETHLAGCSECAAAYQAVAARAKRVSLLLGELSADVPVAVPAVRGGSFRPVAWAGIAAIAAAVILAVVLSYRRGPEPVRVVPQAPVAVSVPAPAVSDPVPAVAVTAAAPVRRAPRVTPRPPRATSVQYYMGLDEEPIDTGVVMRVALPTGMQADVIVDGDGRARAIRPVQSIVKENQP